MRSLVLLCGCLVLPGYEALKGPKEISGFEGDTVSLRCTYEAELRKHRKYWCKQGGIVVSRCASIIYTTDEQEVKQGRTSIRDSPRELSITVTMRSLTLQDAGKYWCGIDRLGFDEAFLIKLTVFPGSSRPAIWLPTTPKDSSLVPSRSSSQPRVSIPLVRMLAPVLVLLSLLLAAGLIAFGSRMLRWRKQDWQVTETAKNEKVYLPASPFGNGWATDAMINLATPPEPLSSPMPPADPCAEIQYLSQTTEAALSPHAEEDMVAAPPGQMPEEELRFSEFISV